MDDLEFIEIAVITGIIFLMGMIAVTIQFARDMQWI